MAGIDKDFTGEAWPGENITVGYLEQEPQLDESKTVLENVKDGARDGGHGRALQPDRHGMAEEDADFDALGRRWPSFRTRSTRSMAGRSTTSSKSRWKRCAARPATGRWQAFGR
jgi:ATPase subunit of ABC transporter with duplicated ATPase domains